MVLLAFSVQHQVEKYGAYVGIAAFFGLAILSLLYFAQAREVKRLREWAGRAPERAQELEQAVVEHAQETRRVPAPQPAPVQRTVLPEPVAATNGAVKLQPAEVAALAFARAAGVHEPHEPKPHPVPVAAAAVAAPATQVVDPPAPEPAVNGVGNGAPPPATPAARRAETPPPPLPPRRKAPPARRPVAAPPPRESNTRAVILTAVIGVVVLVAAAALAFGVFGGGDGDQANTNGGTKPGATSTPDKAGTPKPTPASIKKSDAKIFVFNATGVGQLAAKYRDALVGEAYPKANTEIGSLAEDQ
jgi:hypothetical protein